MNVLASLFRFELGYQIRQPAFFVTTLLLLGASFFATASEDLQRVRGFTTTVNGPYAVVMTHLVLSIIAMFLVGHFVGRAATRDRAHDMDGLVLTAPVPTQTRLLGQLLGAAAVCLVAFLAVSIGSAAGAFWPEIAAEQRGPFRLAPYVWVYLVMVLPNLFFCAVMLYSLARVVRSMMGMYLGLVAFFVFYEVGTEFLNNPGLRSLAALLDPFGFSAFIDATGYWTAEEKNQLLAPVTGPLLLNRVLWLCIAAATLSLLLRFHDERRERPAGKRAKQTDDAEAPVPALPQRRARPSSSGPSGLRQFLARTRLETTQLIGSPAFLILSLLASFLLIAGLFAGDGFYGTRSWPLTRMLSESVQGGLSLLILIVLSYYAAEAVWRERQVGVSSLIDAAPVHNAVLYLSKLIALWAVIIGLCAVGVGIAVIYQTASGYTDYEWSVYAQTLSLQYLLPAMFVAVLSMLIQIVSPNKYVGMLIFAGYVVASLVLPQLGLEHHLWRYSEGPEAIYSDMNGLDHFLAPLLSYHLFWGLFGAALVVIGYGLWPRGTGVGLLARARATRVTVGRPGALVLALCLAAFAATGSYIHHNTNVLNDYRSADAALDWRADYERELKGYEGAPLPVIRAVSVDVAIYPESRRVTVSGQYRLRNETAAPIDAFLLSWDTNNDVAFTLENARATRTYEALSAVLVTLDEPLAPGAERTLEFTVDRRNEGFREREVDNRVVANGTFINNQELLPRIGYDADQELQDARDRAKRGLGDWPGLADLDDETQYGRTYLGADVHRVDLDVTVSTHVDQTALAPGRLLREWVDGERRFFHYRTDQPVLNFFTVLSGHYLVETVDHNGVEIAVYYHPRHDMNVARMIEATRDSLDYFGAEFGPYQYQHVRIVEFPRYESFAQSFANTIPYSEDIGFVADLRDASTLDYVYSVTAHELAHQWWGHQIAPANVQGGTVLSESLAQYSAYMLIHDRYGPAYLRRFLKWELDRYLRGRSNEIDEEQVLMRAENKSYIHYQKGGLVLYALQDVMGADRVHAALRDLLDSYRDNLQVFPTTRDLLARLRAEADPASEAFIEDGFERIMIYDLSIASAVGRALPSGGYQIEVTVNAAKADATGGGRGTPVELDEQIEIGLLRAHPDAPMTADDVIDVTVSMLSDGTQSLTLVSDERPEFVAVDPFLKRIDRDTEDNTVTVSWSD